MLPYRSIIFENRLENTSDQEAAVINFTDNSKYTRKTQWSLLPNSPKKTFKNKTITYEIPCSMDLNPEDRIVDFFCGLGNFTIPLAKHAKKVLGIESDSDMIKLARENAKLNDFNNVKFIKSDLYRPDSVLDSICISNYNKIILDPPRSGASFLISQLNLEAVSLVIYVSCNASTLAQDAKILINKYGYEIGNVFMLDMFPQTIHFESIMVFKK